MPADEPAVAAINALLVRRQRLPGTEDCGPVKVFGRRLF